MTINGFSVHGHFYQPPREDPLTGEIPHETGAAPYPNWNERIFDHCYKPNAKLGNFQRISFNIGPTLWEWMATQHPRTSNEMIAQVGRSNRKNGSGNAMAQPYNHTILPLASREDKRTQIRWGLEDFQYHFGFKARGMWLPETAVDLETLEIMQECGVEFTILAPWQSPEGEADSNQVYKIQLGRNRHMALFFYNRELSSRVSFDPQSTRDASEFMDQLVLPQFSPPGRKQKKDRLVLIATDGELYGHHQPFRDKFLSFLLTGAIDGRPVEATYPAKWLDSHPPKKLTTIRENTSWSCMHGVERWRGVCGCTLHPEWKAPLRKAMETLGRQLDEIYYSEMRHHVEDPWELRHRYIEVLHGINTLDRLMAELGGWAPAQIATMEKLELLLAAQFERQRMFTSCAWFFEDFNRIEPRNNVRYAAQAVWLTRLATGIDLSTQAKALLREVKSSITRLRGDTVFEQHMEKAERMSGRMKRR